MLSVNINQKFKSKISNILNIKNGVIKKPPPTPKRPDNTPTNKLKKSKRKISTLT